ncbi:hypothetical protein K4F52_001414 [Lecanicillium sp. MT-2017a]|nr:hypothetical protein K4F52_001414 [Lecanicillium sp. MT-2017a]
MARRRLRLSPAIIAPLFLACLAPALAFDPDFDFYPKAAQPCMYQAAKSSKCTGDTPEALNKCLCGNGGNFIINTAKCLGEKDKKDVGNVYTTMSGACTDSNTLMSVSQSDFFAAANGKLETTTSSSSSPTSTPTASPTSSTDPTATPTNTDDADPGKKDGSLSTGATIGIAVGASIGGVALLGALVFYLIRRSKRSKVEETHPMLSHDYKSPRPTTFPPQEPSPAFGNFGNESKHSSWDRVHASNPYDRDSYLSQNTGSPDPRQHSFMAGSHYSSVPSEQGTQYVGPYAPPGGVAELPPDAAVHGNSNSGSHVFEMDGSNVSSSGGGQRYEPYRPRQ